MQLAELVSVLTSPGVSPDVDNLEELFQKFHDTTLAPSVVFDAIHRVLTGHHSEKFNRNGKLLDFLLTYCIPSLMPEMFVTSETLDLLLKLRSLLDVRVGIRFDGSIESVFQRSFKNEDVKTRQTYAWMLQETERGVIRVVHGLELLQDNDPLVQFIAWDVNYSCSGQSAIQVLDLALQLYPQTRFPEVRLKILKCILRFNNEQLLQVKGMAEFFLDNFHFAVGNGWEEFGLFLSILQQPGFFLRSNHKTYLSRFASEIQTATKNNDAELILKICLVWGIVVPFSAKTGVWKALIQSYQNLSSRSVAAWFLLNKVKTTTGPGFTELSLDYTISETLAYLPQNDLLFLFKNAPEEWKVINLTQFAQVFSIAQRFRKVGYLHLVAISINSLEPSLIKTYVDLLLSEDLTRTRHENREPELIEYKHWSLFILNFYARKATDEELFSILIPAAKFLAACCEGTLGDPDSRLDDNIDSKRQGILHKLFNHTKNILEIFAAKLDIAPLLYHEDFLTCIEFSSDPKFREIFNTSLEFETTPTCHFPEYNSDPTTGGTHHILITDRCDPNQVSEWLQRATGKVFIQILLKHWETCKPWIEILEKGFPSIHGYSILLEDKSNRNVCLDETLMLRLANAVSKVENLQSFTVRSYSLISDESASALGSGIALTSSLINCDLSFPMNEQQIQNLIIPLQSNATLISVSGMYPHHPDLGRYGNVEAHAQRIYSNFFHFLYLFEGQLIGPNKKTSGTSKERPKVLETVGCNLG